VSERPTDPVPDGRAGVAADGAGYSGLVDVTLQLNRGIPDVPWARHELLALLEHSAVSMDPDRVGLVVTELLTNALLHGAEPVEVHANANDGVLRIEVHDCSQDVPLERSPDPTDLGGRGLMLVAGLAERWGVSQSRGGKVVWAEFDGRARVGNHATANHQRTGAL
jgi:anti-sigma regulatory factor (Ser/Thr protein kinase)